MYLLYLDESGSHAGSPSLTLAGLAVHEKDAWFLQGRLHRVLLRLLPKGFNPLDFELHANEIKSPIKPGKPPSIWARVPVATRFRILHATYQALADFSGKDQRFPCALFGAVVDRRFTDREKRGYEEVLNRFDEMLTRQGHETGDHQAGIVIHDKRKFESDVQGWTGAWRRAAGRIGKLTHLADVPLFADSKASRLIQAADFVAWGLNRFYGDTKDERWIKIVWQRFDKADGVMHGLIHVTPDFRTGGCGCPPCLSRRPAATTP